RAIGFGQFEQVEIDDLDLTSVDFKRPVRRGATTVPPRGGGERATAAGRIVRARGVRIVPVGSNAGRYAGRSDVRFSPRAASGQTGPTRMGGDAASLLEQVIAAKGGKAALDAVKRIKAV